MKLLTENEVKKIEKDRDTIYEYIRDKYKNDAVGMGAAIEALAEISCICGINSNPFKQVN